MEKKGSQEYQQKKVGSRHKERSSQAWRKDKGEQESTANFERHKKEDKGRAFLKAYRQDLLHCGCDGDLLHGIFDYSASTVRSLLIHNSAHTSTHTQSGLLYTEEI